MPIKSPLHQLSMSEVKDLSQKLGIDMRNNMRNKEKAVSHLSSLVDYSDNKFILKPREVASSEVQGKQRAPKNMKPKPLPVQDLVETEQVKFKPRTKKQN